MATNNAVNLSGAGIVTHDGSGVISGNTVTEGGILRGLANNTLNSTGVLGKGTMVRGTTGSPGTLPVGADTEVLTINRNFTNRLDWISQTDAGVGSFVYIQKSTASADTNLQFDIPQSGFTSFMFVAQNLSPSSDGAFFSVRTKATGSGAGFDNTSGDYTHSSMYQGSSSGGGANTTDTEIRFASCGSATNETMSAIIWVYDAAASTYTRFSALSQANDATLGQTAEISGGARLSAAGIERVRFAFTAGNFDGEIKMWGIRDS